MQSIHRHDVPEFLRKGDLFAALDPDDLDQFEVPSECFKRDPNIYSEEDLFFLLKSLRFWQICNLPFEALTFILLHETPNLDAEFPSFAATFEKIKKIKEADPGSRIIVALNEGHGLSMVRWLHENMECELNVICCRQAACSGDIESLAYLHENGCPWDQQTRFCAIILNRINCLEYAETHGCDPLTGICGSLDWAALGGHIEMIKHLRNAGEQWDEKTMAFAATHRSIACMQYLHEQGCPWDLRTPRAAAVSGCLENLQFAHEQGCEWDACTTHAAARHGSLDCLKYAHKHGCPWHGKVACVALIRGHWRCLWYATRHGAEYIVVLSLILPSVLWLVCCTVALRTLIYNSYPWRRVGWFVTVSSVVSIPCNMVHFLTTHLREELTVYISADHQSLLHVAASVCSVIVLVYVLVGSYWFIYYPEWFVDIADAL